MKIEVDDKRGDILRVFFSDDDSDYLTIKHLKDGIEIQGANALRIHPDASTMIKVKMDAPRHSQRAKEEVK